MTEPEPERCPYTEQRATGLWVCRRAPHGSVDTRVGGERRKIVGHFMVNTRRQPEQQQEEQE